MNHNKKPMKQIACLIIVAILFVGCKNDKEPPASSPADDVKPEIILEDPFAETNLVENIKLVDLDNNPVDLRILTGKKIFLNFWATWCKPCIKEMPSIERASKLLADDDFIFLLASDESIGHIKRFQATKEFDLKFIRVETPFPDIGILSLPTTLIIDQNGRISMNQTGALEWDSPEVLEKLRGKSM